MWQAQIQTEEEDENGEDEDASSGANVDEQKTIDAKFEVAEQQSQAGPAQQDDASFVITPVNGHGPQAPHTNGGPSPSAEHHVDPFTVDIERGVDSISEAPRSTRASVQNEVVPASQEDLSSPPMLDEGEEETDVLLPTTPAKSSTKRSASIKSAASSKHHVAFPSGDRPALPHSVSDHSGLNSNTLQTIASSQSTTSSLAAGSPQGMTRSNSTDVASLSSPSEAKKRKSTKSFSGMVRRVSEQGKAKIKSVTSSPSRSRPGSPAMTSSPLNETTPLMPEPRATRFSLSSNATKKK